MRLSGIRLSNYRRFRDARVRFPDGVIGVVGRNGAGKSTLLEAILWALFGHDAARTSKDLLKRQDAAPGDDVVVRLEFELDGASVAVTRRLRGRVLQPEASVEADGNVLVAPGANSWEQANAFVARLLGFDRASFESTVVAKQGEVAALTELRPAQRKRVLLGLLGIDRVDEAIQAARADGRIAEARLEEARRALGEEDAVRAELDSARVDLAAARSQRGRAEAEAASARSRHAAADAADLGLLGKRIRDQELRVRLQGLQGRLEGIWSQRSRLAAEAHLARERCSHAPRLRAQVAHYADLDERISRSDASRAAWQGRKAVEARVARVREEISALEKAAVDGPDPAAVAHACSAADRKHGEHVAAAERARAALGVVSAQLESMETALAAPAPDWKASHSCPTCGRALGRTAARLREQGRHARDAQRQESARLRSERDRLAGAASAESVAAEATSQEGRRLDDAWREAERARTEREAARARLERLRAEETQLLAELSQAGPAPSDEAERQRLLLERAERDRLREELARLEEALRRVDRIQDEDRLQAAHDQETVRDREAASRELRAVGYEAGAWERAHEEAEALRRRLESLEREIVQWRERAEARSMDVARLEAHATRLESRRAETAALETRLGLLETLAARRGDGGVLPEFRTHLIGRVRPALARAAGSLLSQMTQGRYTEVTLDEEYGAALYDGPVAHPLARFSGGEGDVCNLALRLAVSELVANARGRSRLQFVALDEVFASQDAERRDAILRSLGTLSRVFRQVLVVTHMDDVRDRVQHVLLVEEAEDGAGRLTPSWDDEAAAEPGPAGLPADPPLAAPARA